MLKGIPYEWLVPRLLQVATPSVRWTPVCHTHNGSVTLPRKSTRRLQSLRAFLFVKQPATIPCHNDTENSMINLTDVLSCPRHHQPLFLLLELLRPHTNSTKDSLPHYRQQVKERGLGYLSCTLRSISMLSLQPLGILFGNDNKK